MSKLTVKDLDLELEKLKKKQEKLHQENLDLLKQEAQAENKKKAISLMGSVVSDNVTILVKIDRDMVKISHSNEAGTHALLDNQHFARKLREFLKQQLDELVDQ